MRRIDWDLLSDSERCGALARPKQRRDEKVVQAVATIFEDVEREGEAAVARWSLAIDKSTPSHVELTAQTLATARASVAREDIEALELAIHQVRSYHQATGPRDESIEAGGLRSVRTWRPIPACGLYIPGGSAPLFSTLYMLAAPAHIAGVPSITAVTPPRPDGVVHPMMLLAAAACQLESISIVGGAQAIAALTFGAGLPKADKICGPGNVYVTEAKRLAASLPGGPQIDTPAGPSELMVIADTTARADVVAADLLSQAEHDADAQVLLVTESAELANAVAAELNRQIALLPRAEIASASLAQARLIIVRDIAAASDVANTYAPEHLCLNVRDADAMASRITHAGAVFVGAETAETFGDYINGPSHVLPTDGAARSWSGVSVASFMKSMTLQSMTQAAAAKFAPAAARLARLEGLEAHARAAEIRGTA